MILASEASNMGDHKGAKPPYRADKPAERVVSSSLQLFVNLLQLSINYFSKTEQSNLLEELAKLDIPVWQYEQSALCKRQIDEFLPVVCPIFETEYFLSSSSMGCVVVHMRTQ